MPAEFIFRGYAPSFLDAMFCLDEACFAEPFRFSSADMRRFAEARNAYVLLALQGRELAGFSIVHLQRNVGTRVAYLTTLDIAPMFRRRGLARQLMRGAEEQARKAKCEAMHLHVFTGNEAAVELYEKLGYTRVALLSDFYDSGLDAWFYRKMLNL